MIKIGQHEIEHDGTCWVLRFRREKKPTKKNPTPEGLSTVSTYYGSLEQAAMRLADLDAAAIQSCNDIVSSMQQTRDAICAAISAS